MRVPCWTAQDGLVSRCVPGGLQSVAGQNSGLDPIQHNRSRRQCQSGLAPTLTPIRAILDGIQRTSVLLQKARNALYKPVSRTKRYGADIGQFLLKTALDFRHRLIPL